MWFKNSSSRKKMVGNNRKRLISEESADGSLGSGTSFAADAWKLQKLDERLLLWLWIKALAKKTVGE